MRQWPPKDAPDGETVISKEAIQFLRRFNNSAGMGICITGGGDLDRPLFEAALIDETGFNIHHVLLGSSIALVQSMGRAINLELKECRAFQNECLLQHISTQERGLLGRCSRPTPPAAERPGVRSLRGSRPCSMTR
jgi:dihydrofolate reductase